MCWQTVEQQFIPALAIASSVSGHCKTHARNPNMTNRDDELLIHIKRRPDWKAIIVIGIFLLFIPIIFGNEIYKLFVGKIKLDGISLTFIIATISIVYIAFLQRFLWLLRGQEKVTIKNQELIIEKLGALLSNSETYKLEKIKSFTLTKKNFIYSFKKNHGERVGEIQFEYFGNFIKFGETLTQEEAVEIIKQLNDKINNEPLTNAIANAGLRDR